MFNVTKLVSLRLNDYCASFVTEVLTTYKSAVSGDMTGNKVASVCNSPWCHVFARAVTILSSARQPHSSEDL